jgi:nucleotide-binding universal stress UspA family protein
MFSNIVVGTDGSGTSRKAVALAADLARQHGAVLHLVNAYKIPSMHAAGGLGGPIPAPTDDMNPEALMDSSKDLLDEVARTLEGLKAESHSVLGSAVEVIISVAESVDADVIVVGSKGMRGARRMIGSVPNSIAHRAPCHVLIAKTA